MRRGGTHSHPRSLEATLALDACIAARQHEASQRVTKPRPVLGSGLTVAL